MDPLRRTIEVGADGLAIEEVCALADGAGLRLGAAARQRIAASRHIVDLAVSGDALVYGLNTGLGHLRDERVPLDVLREYQRAIVRVHAGGFGEPLATRIVRAAMAVRVAGIARGGAGASLAAAETLAAMLTAGVHPIVPSVGSVGASDLMHMAAIAVVAIGDGRAEFQGELLDGATAMARAGIRLLELAPKDGLAMISANGVSVGHAALTVTRCRASAEAADVVALVSLEAIRGNPSIVEESVARAKGIDGQTEASRHLRALLGGSDLLEQGAARSVQDPLSFRVMPQVHGALRELTAFATTAVAVELRAMDDNPLVSVEDGRLISNGNFHPIVMALAFDALRPAIAHVGQLSERRCGRLWDELFKDPDLATPEGMSAATAGGAPLLRYAAAARYAELRALAAPVTLDVPALDLGFEDHATNAPATVEQTARALDRLDDILAVELLLGHRLLASGGPARLAGSTRAVLRAIDAELAAMAPGATSADVHSAIVGLVRGGALAAAAHGV